MIILKQPAGDVPPTARAPDVAHNIAPARYVEAFNPIAARLFDRNRRAARIMTLRSAAAQQTIAFREGAWVQAIHGAAATPLRLASHR